jgi:hypothetical protein
MTHLIPEPLIWAVVAVVIYGLLTRGLFLATDEVRQSLVDRAAALLENPNFPEDEKAIILSFLDDAHSALSAWALVIAAIRAVFAYPFYEAKKDRTALDREYDAFTSRWLFATLGNSVPATLLFSFLMVISVAFRRSIRPFTGAVVDQRDPHHAGHRATA